MDKKQIFVLLGLITSALIYEHRKLNRTIDVLDRIVTVVHNINESLYQDVVDETFMEIVENVEGE